MEHAKLAIERHERTCMHDLAEFLARSPRRAKRFLNVYRVLKASLPPDRYADLVRSRGASGDYRAILTLLSIMTGAPSASDHVFTRIAAARDASTVKELIEELGAQPRGPDMERALGALRRYITMVGTDKAPVAPLRKWRAHAARYSFAFQYEAPKMLPSDEESGDSEPIAAVTSPHPEPQRESVITISDADHEIELPVSSVPTMTALTDAVWLKLRRAPPAYSYGSKWWISKDGQRLPTRPIEGEALIDGRNLEDLGVRAGDRLTVERA
jgi:hypothetical protein